MTLGIGDGANDVEMLRAAHVGVGVIGKEGTQAVNNSDYAIGQFRFLTRLILVYGHRSYRGITLASLLIFYKNIIFTLIQYFYTFLCGLSGTFDRILSRTGTRNQSYIAIFWYNTALTAFGPLLLAIFDKDISDANCIRFPQLHREGIDHRLFSVRRFLLYFLKAVYEALIMFLVLYYVLDTADFPIGTVDVWSFGMVAVTICIFVANLSSSSEQSIMFFFSSFCFWGTFIFWLLLVLSTSFSISLYPNYFHSFDLLFQSPIFYLLFVLATVLALLPTMMTHAIQREESPSLSQFIQDVQVRDADPEVVKTSLEEMEKKRSLELELKTMRDKPQDVDIPELMQVTPEAVESMEISLEQSRMENDSQNALRSSPTPYDLMKTGNAYRSIRSIAGLRALTICQQLHGPSYDSQSVNDEAQADLINKINSHHWRSAAKPDLIGSLKTQFLDKSPVTILKKVGDSLKKEIAPRMILEPFNKLQLSVVKEVEEELIESVPPGGELETTQEDAYSDVELEVQATDVVEIEVKNGQSDEIQEIENVQKEEEEEEPRREDSEDEEPTETSDVIHLEEEEKKEGKEIESEEAKNRAKMGKSAEQNDRSECTESEEKKASIQSSESKEPKDSKDSKDRSESSTSLSVPPPMSTEVVPPFPDQASTDPLTTQIFPSPLCSTNNPQ